MRSLAWYQAKGSPYSGYTDVDSVHRDYVLAKTGLSTNGKLSVADLDMYLLSTTIASPITAGSRTDRWKAFYAAKTSLAATLDYDYLENQFYANNSLDFA